jgi:uncharacterized membrane protein HdeD (DUF308 family)
MPLPPAPLRKLSQSSKEMLHKGVMCLLIGLAVLIAPRFMASPSFAGIVAQSALVGWFALILGAALIGRGLWRR